MPSCVGLVHRLSCVGLVPRLSCVGLVPMLSCVGLIPRLSHVWASFPGSHVWALFLGSHVWGLVHRFLWNETKIIVPHVHTTHVCWSFCCHIKFTAWIINKSDLQRKEKNWQSTGTCVVTCLGSGDQTKPLSMAQGHLHNVLHSSRYPHWLSV